MKTKSKPKKTRRTRASENQIDRALRIERELKAYIDKLYEDDLLMEALDLERESNGELFRSWIGRLFPRAYPKGRVTVRISWQQTDYPGIQSENGSMSLSQAERFLVMLQRGCMASPENLLIPKKKEEYKLDDFSKRVWLRYAEQLRLRIANDASQLERITVGMATGSIAPLFEHQETEKKTEP